MVSDDCRSAFYCSVFAQSEESDGCLKECDEGQIIDINRCGVDFCGCIFRDVLFSGRCLQGGVDLDMQG